MKASLWGLAFQSLGCHWVDRGIATLLGLSYEVPWALQTRSANQIGYYWLFPVGSVMIDSRHNACFLRSGYKANRR
jgi:hypothetical protein